MYGLESGVSCVLFFQVDIVVTVVLVSLVFFGNNIVMSLVLASGNLEWNWNEEWGGG